MKKTWEEPSIMVQQFMPNEYVAACVTGTLQCAIPGDSPYACGDGTSARNYSWRVYAGIDQWGGPRITPDGKNHGICAEPTSISFASGTGTGYEMNHGVLDRTRPIYNIDGYNLSTGTYKVTWKSNNGYQVYNHYGMLTITNIDNDRPNHS